MITQTDSTEAGDGNQADPPCVNLRVRFGDRFKVRYEESYSAEHGGHGRADEPWLMILLCQHGHICPWGDDLLAACTKDNAPIIMKRLLALPFIKLAESQLACDGAGLTVNPVTTPTCGNIVFPVEHIEAVLEIMRPKTRYYATEAQKKVLDAGRAAGTKALADYRLKLLDESGRSLPESTFCPLDGSEDQEHLPGGIAMST